VTGDRFDADVVVVGGGLAGLAAALRAADAGASVVVVERRRRLGGLTWSFERGGLRFDNGQHVFLRCCDAYRGFLDRLGASGDVVLQDRLHVPVLRPGGRAATIGRSGWPAPLHLTGAVARYSHLSVTDRLRLVPAVAALRRVDPDDPVSDRRSFGSWLAAHGQRPEAIAALWDLITVPTVNLPAAEASLAMGAKVFRTGLLDRADGADIGWSAVPLGELHGTRAAAALAAAGAEVVTGAKVVAVDRAPHRRGATDGGWTVVADDGRRWTGRAAVLAVPPLAAARLAPPRRLPDVQALGTSPIVDVQLVLDRRVTDLPMLAAIDSPVQFVFDRTDTAGLDRRRGQVLALSLSAAEGHIGRRPADLVVTLAAALGELLPAMHRAAIVDAVVTKEPAATFRAVPGSGRLRPVPGAVAPGLAVAGAWCATGWPATMEGAVRAGVAAADAVVPARCGAHLGSHGVSHGSPVHGSPVPGAPVSRGASAQGSPVHGSSVPGAPVSRGASAQGSPDPGSSMPPGVVPTGSSSPGAPAPHDTLVRTGRPSPSAAPLPQEVP
jgi:squalene-associated FAD-dependent desaturase